MATQQDELVEKIRAYVGKRYGDASLASFRKLFSDMDRDGDAQIDGRELQTLLKDAGVGNVLSRGAFAERILDVADTSGDRRIGWPEFEALLRQSGVS